MNPPLRVSDLVVQLGGRTVLDGVALTLAAGQVTGLIGPNGSGKTTLVRAMFRAVRPTHGSVLVEGTAVEDLARAALARRVAAVVQEPEFPAGVTVAETVELGRLPHRGDLGRLGHADRAAVEEAARAADVQHLLDRELGELSGGERQRAHVARAVAQQAPVLLLDEPTNHLDIRHQFALMATLRDLAREGTAVALAIHDLSLAARSCDAVVVLDRGRVVAYGDPSEVLCRPEVASVFGVATSLDGSGRLLVDPA